MYDEVNRLKRVETGGGTAAEYSYDGAGNRIQIQGPDLVPPVTTALPLGGIYNTNQSVTLTCNDAFGAGCSKIYYTTNGTAPTTSSAVYSTPISIIATTTVKYFAKDRAGNSEAVKSQTYTISAP